MSNYTVLNKYLNPTPESVVALRGRYRGGAAQLSRVFQAWY